MNSLLQFFLEDRSPFTRVISISSKAELPTISIQLMHAENSPVNLTSYTATFSLKTEAGVSVFSSSAATITDAINGKLSFQLPSPLTYVGRYYGQFTITKSSDSYLIPNNGDQKLMIVVSSSV